MHEVSNGESDGKERLDGSVAPGDPTKRNKFNFNELIVQHIVKTIFNGTILILVIAAATILGYKTSTVVYRKNSDQSFKTRPSISPSIPSYIQNAPTAAPFPTRQPLGVMTNNPVKGQIIFAEQGDIYMINVDRSGKELILGDGNNKYGLAISPDKRWLGYVFYSKDESLQEKLGGGGAFGPPIAGLGLYDLVNKKNVIIVPFDSTARLYAYYNIDFSPDSQFLSAWDVWGRKVILAKTETGQIVLNFDVGEDYETGVSPFSFIPESNLASVILKNELFNIDLKTTVINKINEGLDPYRPRHEASSVPENVLYSPDGKFSVFYRKSNLYLQNVGDTSEKLISPAESGDMFENYPTAFAQAFSYNSEALVLDGPNYPTTNLLNVDNLSITPIASFGSSLVTSYDNKVVIGMVSGESGHPNYVVGKYNLETQSYVKCPPSNFEYNYSSWGGGPIIQPPLRVLSRDNSAIVGKMSGGEENIAIFNLNTCEPYVLLYGKELSSPIWF